MIRFLFLAVLALSSCSVVSADDYGYLYPTSTEQPPVPPVLTGDAYRASLVAERAELQRQIGVSLEYVILMLNMAAEDPNMSFESMYEWQWRIMWQRSLIAAASARIDKIDILIDAYDNGV